MQGNAPAKRQQGQQAQAADIAGLSRPAQSEQNATQCADQQSLGHNQGRTVTEKVDDVAEPVGKPGVIDPPGGGCGIGKRFSSGANLAAGQEFAIGQVHPQFTVACGKSRQQHRHGGHQEDQGQPPRRENKHDDQQHEGDGQQQRQAEAQHAGPSRISKAYPKNPQDNGVGGEGGASVGVGGVKVPGIERVVNVLAGDEGGCSVAAMN